MILSLLSMSLLSGVSGYWLMKENGKKPYGYEVRTASYCCGDF